MPHDTRTTATAAVEITEFADPVAGRIDLQTADAPPADATDITEFVAIDSLGGYPPFPNPLKHPLQCIAWTVRSLFGIATLILLLAVIAAVPLASLFVLGYLLEVEGRVARTGKLRYAFPLLHRAPRLGTIALGIGLWLLPLFYLAGLAADAQLIEPAGPAASGWRTAKIVVAAAVAVHLCLALARGGSLGCFFRPLKNVLWLLAELRNRPKGRRSNVVRPDTYWQRADRRVRAFLRDFRLKHHFVLGGIGFVGAFAILLWPTLLFAAAESTSKPLPILATLAGGVALAVAFLYVPFLQARLAAEKRLSAAWELRAVRRLFCHAPIAWFLALLLVYALALPLYLFTAFALPTDARWMLMLVFVASIWPARVAAGWAYARAVRRQQAGRRPAWWGFHWVCRTAMLAVTAFYTLLFFFARDIGTHGRLVLFEHHAFLGTVLSSLFALLP